jgi:pimeloyl-ACP methyl ester carboxylesterase
MPPLWSEGRIGFELAALMRSRVWKGEGVEHAGGQPVMLIPGFLAGDGSLGQMTQWLRRTGHRTSKAGMRSNIDCSSKAVERLAERLEVMAEAQGQRVAIIGQSRGGNFAKVLAVRHPELVSGIVTLGSPQLDPFKIHPLIRMQVFAVGTLGTIGLRGFFKHSCRTGECCEDFWEELRSPLRQDVGYLSVYSKRDGVVDWRACLDPHAEHLEITASHCGMAVNARAYGAIAKALSDFRAGESKPRGGRKPVKAQQPARLRRAA